MDMVDGNTKGGAKMGFWDKSFSHPLILAGKCLLIVLDKSKGNSHSRLAAEVVNVRVPHVSLGTACEGWCSSPLPLLPKPFPAVKRVEYPFAAG